MTARQLTPRPIGAINWIGLWTLYRKEVRRFLKVFTQTVAAPVVTTLLFFAVFALALGQVARPTGDVPFLDFLAPGLVMMSMAQNAFANTSSSVMIAKVQGNIVDVLMPPLSSLELAIGYVAGGITRGVLVGFVTLLAVAPFADVGIHSFPIIVFHAVMASMLLSLLGILGGIWAEKFDHIAAFTNFVVTPMTFLSGTFYSVSRLPEALQWIAHVNPFFYMIDGFRYGFIGVADGNLLAGVAMMVGVNVGLVWLLMRLLASGYKLKA